MSSSCKLFEVNVFNSYIHSEFLLDSVILFFFFFFNFNFFFIALVLCILNSLHSVNGKNRDSLCFCLFFCFLCFLGKDFVLDQL